jgi:hypothetical protein
MARTDKAMRADAIVFMAVPPKLPVRCTRPISIIAVTGDGDTRDGRNCDGQTAAIGRKIQNSCAPWMLALRGCASWTPTARAFPRWMTPLVGGADGALLAANAVAKE